MCLPNSWGPWSFLVPDSCPSLLSRATDPLPGVIGGSVVCLASRRGSAERLAECCGALVGSSGVCSGFCAGAVGSARGSVRGTVQVCRVLVGSAGFCAGYWGSLQGSVWGTGGVCGDLCSSVLGAGGESV